MFSFIKQINMWKSSHVRWKNIAGARFSSQVVIHCLVYQCSKYKQWLGYLDLHSEWLLVCKKNTQGKNILRWYTCTFFSPVLGEQSTLFDLWTVVQCHISEAYVISTTECWRTIGFTVDNTYIISALFTKFNLLRSTVRKNY